MIHFIHISEHWPILEYSCHAVWLPLLCNNTGVLLCVTKCLYYVKYSLVQCAFVLWNDSGNILSPFFKSVMTSQTIILFRSNYSWLWQYYCCGAGECYVCNVTCPYSKGTPGA